MISNIKSADRPLLKWSRLKRLYASTNLNSLFYATFTTLISLLATTVLPSVATNKTIAETIDPSRLLESMLAFFLAALFWYVGVALFEVSIPLKIVSNASIEEYVDRALSLPTYENSQERIDAALKEADEWDRVDTKFGPIRFAIAMFGTIAGLCYLGALILFCRSILGFALYLSRLPVL